MKRAILAAGLLFGTSWTGIASAQPRYAPPVGVSPNPQPSFSPYLNLFRRGNPIFLNYYGLTRPQMDFYSSIGQLQRNLNAVAQAGEAQAADGDAPLPATGHAAGFMTHGKYFGGGAAAKPVTATQSVQPAGPRSSRSTSYGGSGNYGSAFRR